ncbi:MAG TPA: BatA domain-containing protein, partial [Polyangiales bacterium]|nr:BatA domain-containing protein [Polyangiales bacterium]
MGLEAPLALLGLLGVLLPLILHRMRKRELPHVVLPTFALLTRALARSRQRQAFTDVWLLVLRIALIAIAALALAVPYLTTQLSFGDGHLANVVVVVDDSLSMARVDAGTPLIERARAR